jgi:hypothetical protein
MTAHVAGLPLEEALPALAAWAGAMAQAARGWRASRR